VDEVVGRRISKVRARHTEKQTQAKEDENADK